MSSLCASLTLWIFQWEMALKIKIVHRDKSKTKQLNYQETGKNDA